MSKYLNNTDHVAVQVSDVSNALVYYAERFECEVTYQDTTWALIKFENIKYHRDGIGYIYTKDLERNFIEILDRSSR
tara:strand:+ start:9893 stop:10123 length:231 start_codon:yes stop_codon:yes gene_type:complete